jgi:uncharacterized protein (DUF305 family)
MKLRAFRIAVVSTALAAVIALTGCSSDRDASGTDGSSLPPVSPSSVGADLFDDVDVIFVQMMVPHHQQAVDMSDIVLSKRGVSPDVRALAKHIKAAQQPEIEMMNAWLEKWGRIEMAEESSHHDGTDGMMTEEQMQALDEVRGPDGERLFLEGMIRHHQGAIHNAEEEIASGKNADTVTLAKDIAGKQQAEVAAMTELLNKI